MKKFLSVLMVLVMIVSTLPIVSATETESAPMRVKISGERMYVRTSHNETYDLLQTFRVNGDGFENGEPINEQFEFYEAGLVAKTKETFTDYDNKLANGGDDVAPFKINNQYIGAGHGEPHGLLITAENHGKTYADIGSRWYNEKMEKRIIGIC